MGLEYVVPVLAGICLSACTGFRAFLPPLLIGIVYRFFPGWLHIGQGLAFLAQTPVLIALLVAAAVEATADKIPVVDHALDAIELPVKMVLSALVTVTILPDGDLKSIFLLIALVLGQSATVSVHAGKTGLRAASTVTTGGTANPLISFVEGVIAGVGTVLALVVPVLAVIATAWIVWRSVRYLVGQRGGNEGKLAQTAPSLTFYRFVKNICHFILTVYNRWTIEGLEHMPAKPPYLVVANHASVLDGLILGSALPHPVYIMVKKEAFDNPIIGWFLRKSLAFPVDRAKPDPTSIKTCLRVLADGKVLGIFPEGTRNPRGLIRPFKPGAIKFAVRQKVPVLPAYIANNHLLNPPGSPVPRPVTIKVGFGEPIDVPGMLEQGHTEQEIQDLVYERVCEIGSRLMGCPVRDDSAEEPEHDGNGTPAHDSVTTV
ncbi:MAG TPA: 1-acylglycerol-3-phosphate O-acyltransferase [Candidatus Ozemobacteraceae bacterium]|nr:1-acylglycerol-3-phosphate O-acyltransferase [Candidatus Ozemobacteraceae bacterium]